MENNKKVFKTYSDVNESLEGIESFLGVVDAYMNNISTYGIGHLKFLDENIKIINELQSAFNWVVDSLKNTKKQSAFNWVVDSLKNNTKRQLIDNVKAKTARIYEKMNIINELISDNACKHTDKWLYIIEPPTQAGHYDCTIEIDSYTVNDNPVYRVINLYYNKDNQKWFYQGDEFTKYVKMWFKNY